MIELTVLYDNQATGDLRPGWGFSAFIRTEGATVMLDAGADKLVLEHNADRLGVNLDTVAALAISHSHCDHVGAISSVIHNGLHLYVPKLMIGQLGRGRKSGIDRHAVTGPVNISPGVRSTGRMGRAIPEQALLIDGTDGPALVTGCAHMGIVKLARRATQLAGAPLSLIVGGFHLYKEKRQAIERIALDLVELGVRRVGACHCTGDEATSILRDAYGAGFVDVAVGTRIEL